MTVSVAMQAAVAGPGTAPGWLVKIGATTRLCSWGDDTVMGFDWVGADLEVQGLSLGGNLSSGGRLVLADTDLAWASLHLNGQINGQACEVWYADRGARAPGDPVQVFQGSLAGSAHQPERCTVTARLAPSRAGAAKTPRQRIGPRTGITVQIPAGTVLRVGNTSIVVETARL